MALTFCRAVRDGLLEPSDITEDLIDEYNKIEDAPDVDFLLRTSGERRLSDFLLLQSNYSLIQVERKYFPECTPRDVWRALLSFSQNSSAPQGLPAHHLRDPCRGRKARRPGTSCSRSSRDKSKGPRDLAQSAQQVSQAMHYVGSLGMIHRDLAARNEVTRHVRGGHGMTQPIDCSWELYRW
ncbi:putative undecaprenyl pyrophosphate synthetase [Ixodes scapularis]